MRRIALPLSLALAAAGCHKQEPAAPQATPVAVTPPAPEPTAPVRDNKGKPAPTTELDDLTSGGKVRLADFKGKPLLVNLWATWCVPCVRELPTLDALAKARGDKLEVIAVSEDMEGAKVVKPFLAAHGITALTAHHDNDNGLMLALKEPSLPVTILYGVDGRELWRVAGNLDWGGAKAKALLAEAGI